MTKRSFVDSGKPRYANYSLKEFVANFMWFLDAADDCDKLGIVRMLLANLNCNNYAPNPETKEKLGAMMDDIQTMLEEDPTHKENLTYTYIRFRSIGDHITRQPGKPLPPKEENTEE
jgi:hypothetical protein